MMPPRCTIRRAPVTGWRSCGPAHEDYDGGEAMVEPPVDEIVARIVEAFHPRRIVVFGSRARGGAGPDSDLDLLVEMESDEPPRDRIRAVDALFARRRWSMDLLVYTPEEVRRFKDVVGTILYTIEREGRVLYERQ
jgi:predicted nucleotidyltransferase